MCNFFTKNVLFQLFFIILPLTSLAQKNSFHLFENDHSIDASISAYVKKGTVASFNKTLATQLLNDNFKNIELSFAFENKEWVLELEQATILSNSFFVIAGSKAEEKFLYNKKSVLHYRGNVKGNKNAIAAVSILANNIVAVIADEKGNINIGAINSTTSITNNEYIFYRDTDLLITNEFACQDLLNANENNPIPTYAPTIPTNLATLNAEPIDIYFEVDNRTYINNGNNITATINYVTSLFNVVNLLYELDSVNTKISAIKVWDIPDPYISQTNSSGVLFAFANNMSNGFPGDLAHFLSQRSIGGGIAYLDVLCANNYNKTAVSGNLSNSFNLFPTYSWSVMVVTHEIGHNIGSRHTQACTWPGGAIDNCYLTEGGCAMGPAPVNGGTIMSYCHLALAGINLANGFGPLPGAKIRDRVKNNICLNPSIYFETTAQNIIEETADIANNCLKYKLLTTKIKIPYAPTQPVNVTLLPTGTSGLLIGTNKDIEVLSNNFVIDSNNLSQTINVKVYDDAIIENIESLILNFNINANGGNAVKKTSSNIYFVNITSEDHKPDSTINQLLFYEPFDTITSGLGNWTQTIVHGINSPNRWIIKNKSGGSFTSNAAYISNNDSTLAYSGSSINDSAVLRLESPTISANGYSNLKLSFFYKCTSESIFVNAGQGSTGGSLNYLDYGSVLVSIDNGANWTTILNNINPITEKILTRIDLPEFAGNAPNLKIAFEWRNNSSVVNIPAFIIDSIVIKGTSTAPIQTLMHPNNSDDEYLGPNQTIHYYNTVTKNIIATIENNTAFDFGCTKVDIVRVGDSVSQGWGTLVGDKVSNKVFKITTSNTSDIASYTVKFYFTDAEINGWLNATGNSIADIKIVKTYSDLTTGVFITPIFSSLNYTSSYGVTTQKILSATFSGHEYISNYALMKPYGISTCPNNIISFSTSIMGSSYQWQVDNGNGFVNVTNDSIYSNADTSTLHINAAPTSYIGSKYRCMVTTIYGDVYSQEFVLKYTMTWLGAISAAWENPLNWSCNMVPNDKTDVVINSNTTFEPLVITNTTVRSLTLNNGAHLNISSTANFIINH